MCVQVCPTVLHQGHEKEERLASFPMLVVVLFQCINVLCLVEDFEGSSKRAALSITRCTPSYKSRMSDLSRGHCLPRKTSIQVQP
ncbi:hypothetical protein L3X38_015568 [Prunus dulcis]|uniref:Uncharacterized protein n=1 Tax=Prunus dulcis TaxID=3755 RepID=A0AAD4W659_PRUDU|nr:hypothetical protein L3X38_015568 [Prunus dulcis]